jgi:predicted MFS family arabinose efflux permease
LVTGALPLGAAIAPYLLKNQLKIYSFRKLFIFFDIVAILSSVLYAINYHYYYILVARVISGVCVGVNSALIPAFIREISPHEISGFTGSVNW